MLRLTNLTNTVYDLARYEDDADVAAFCAAHGLDGFELLPYEGCGLSFLPRERVLGVHLTYFPCWVDYWQGNTAGVRAEFGSLAAARAYYGGGRAEMIAQLRAQLDWAEKIGARYAVFHVSDVATDEALTHRYLHTDAAVVRAALEWLGAALNGREYSFDFLVENLWWPGFTFTRPEITRALLDGIPARRKGIMLDTGHLLNTNWDLRTQEEGVAYVLRALEAHGYLAERVYGLHLHQSVSGAYARTLAEHPPVLTGDHTARRGQAYEHILRIDGHRPFRCPEVRKLVERVAPRYLVHEFITEDRAQHEAYLRAQNRALGDART